MIINIIYRYYTEIIENNPKISPDTSKLGLLLGNYDDSNILYRKDLEYDDIEDILKGVLYRYVLIFLIRVYQILRKKYVEK